MISVFPFLESDISEALWRLEIGDNQDGGDAAESSPYPDRPGEPDCLYYMRTGSCSYGSNCRFNHPVYVAQVYVILLLQENWNLSIVAAVAFLSMIYLVLMIFYPLMIE